MPDAVAGQLGNRVLHALRSFTPRDQAAVKAAAKAAGRSSVLLQVQRGTGPAAYVPGAPRYPVIFPESG